jgi:cysteine-rich repeat protein
VQDEDPDDGTIYPGVGNIDDDPHFVDPDGLDDTPGTTDDDMHLSGGSPCIDAGDNTAVPVGVTTDLDGNPRFVDDPGTPDTGNGTPPMTDMGAYEYEACGNGVVDPGEECDDGSDNSDTQPDACRTNCTAASCGDEVVDSGEECDDGNLYDGDLCSGECIIEGACCSRSPDSGGFCTLTIVDECLGAQVVWTGGAYCADVDCDEARGACCDADAGAVADHGICTEGVLLGDCRCARCTWTKDAICSEVDCPADFAAIPAASEWGLVVMTLLLVAGLKVYWGRHGYGVS